MMVLVCTASEAGLVACRCDARYGGAASGERHRLQAAFFSLVVDACALAGQHFCPCPILPL